MPIKNDAKKRTGQAKAKSTPKGTAPARGGGPAKKSAAVGKTKSAAAAKKPTPKAVTKAKPVKLAVKTGPGKSTKASPKPSASAARFSKKPSGGSAAAAASSMSAKAVPVVASAPHGSGIVYSVHPGVQMMVRWASELKGKTGRTLDEWVALLKKDAPAAFEDRVAFLKSKHAMGTNAAWWIAERADGKGAEDLDPDLYLAAAAKYVDEQFEGKKVKLRSLYESMLRTLLSMDARAKACPCKTMVPIYFDHVVAQVKATTNTRIDLGLALGDTKGVGRLIETGGYAKKDRITHRIEITSDADIDGFVKEWISTAYARR